jgi:hypothetical protein
MQENEDEDCGLTPIIYPSSMVVVGFSLALHIHSLQHTIYHPERRSYGCKHPTEDVF